LSTTKFNNFLRSTNFVLVISPSEVVWKIRISNVRKFTWLFLDRWFQMKKSSTIKLHNFLELQLLFWLFLHPRSFEKFEFQMWAKSRDFFMDRWFQMKKLSTTKLYNFLRSTSFVLVVSPSEIVWKFWTSNVIFVR